jgi:peptide methionine sulfoxide reductase msrA/msrB
MHGPIDTMHYRVLTPEEKSVIINKNTEAPFSGKFDNFFGKGDYLCKQCGALLFKSVDKFNSGCGWASFDNAVKGSVKYIPDPDGMRTEIECAHCGGHLGHVFYGEKFTPKNTRYCVNSLSMDFIPDKSTKQATEDTTYFAGGCFWGVQYYMERDPGVTSTTAGYMGDKLPNPTYEEVSSHSTDFAETVRVIFNPSKTTFEKVAKYFFDIHDPTQVNRQGPDVGKNYRSEIFYTKPAQKQTAEMLIGLLKNKGYKVATLVEPATKFWKAEEYHQDYDKKNNETPYCHVYVERF